MSSPTDLSASSSLAPLQSLPRLLLAAFPLPLLQPVLNHVAAHVARSRPELFARLGPHTAKRFLIDPTDLPFVLVLVPNADRPHLRAHHRGGRIRHDAVIAGTFSNLLRMIDGSLDGDAMFFSRTLHVGGDIEAVVALRNALDDFDGNVLDNVLAAFGPLSKPATFVLSAVRAATKEQPREQP